MPILIGDPLKFKVSGIEVEAVAASNEKDGAVQVKYKGTFSTVNVADVTTEMWVLVDPTGRHVDTGGKIYATPNGGTTGDRKSAKTFGSRKAAEDFAKANAGLSTFTPEKVT